MNSLIDCDADASASNALAALTHMYPASGFQYKSTTYWSATCIVGKVLAPTARSIGGWVGPVRPVKDLGRNAIARIRQRKPRQGLAPEDAKSMRERSDPLGPPADHYPVSEYSLLLPDFNEYGIIDTVRVEKLALKVVNSASTTPDSGKPQIYDAAVQFAIDGQSWHLRLSYDVSFVAACPCKNGPHVLFFDYVYKAVKVDEILIIRDWGNLNPRQHNSSSHPGTSSLGTASGKGSGESFPKSSPDEDEKDEKEKINEEEKVLIIEAFGVSDNEVLARAWCSHWGLGAVVADVERTCMSCAVREAYAACLNVVILVEEGRGGSEDD